MSARPASGQPWSFADDGTEGVPCLSGAREHAAVVVLARVKVVIFEAAFFFEQAGFPESDDLLVVVG